MKIETVELPELVLIGTLLKDGQEEAAAWIRLFAADTGASGFLKAQLPLPGEAPATLLGYLGASKTEIPSGMEKIAVAPGRYLRLITDGKLPEGSDPWGALEAQALASRETASGLRMDFGYLPGREDGHHELHLGLNPKTLSLAG